MVQRAIHLKLHIITRVYIYISIFISPFLQYPRVENVFQTIAISASFNYPEATPAEQ